MPECPEPSLALLELLVRRAMARGLPAQEAEDIVLASYHKASAAFDPQRGSFESLYLRIVDNECRFWWRTWQRQERRVLRLAEEPTEPPSTAAAERASENQQRLIEALDEEERRVFSTWALQKHLPRGRLNADDAAGSLGMSVRDWENAKRRLKGRITSLLTSWGLAPRDFFSVEDDERPRRISRG